MADFSLKHGHESNCAGYVYEYHTIYWLLDIVRYLHDVVIRALMLLAIMAIGQIWSRQFQNTMAEEKDKVEPESYID